MERSHLKTAIIIPAFNEQMTIQKVVNSVKFAGSVIVVDDCSTDNTSKMAIEAGAIVVKHNINKGYDSALESGFAKANELNVDFAITLDADGQHPSELLNAMINLFEQNQSLVLGVRDKLPRFSEKLFAFYTKKKFGVKDPCCGLKGYSMKFYQQHGCFTRYPSIGTDLMFSALHSGAKAEQINFKVKERLDKPRFGSVLTSNLKILNALIKTIKYYGL